MLRRLRTSGKKRMKKKLAAFRILQKNEKIDSEAVRRSLVSYRGHLSHGNTYGLMKMLDDVEESL